MIVVTSTHAIYLSRPSASVHGFLAFYSYRFVLHPAYDLGSTRCATQPRPPGQILDILVLQNASVIRIPPYQEL